MGKEKSQTEQVVYQVSRMSILLNTMLSLLKLMAGILGKSGAMVSDALHSMSDVFSTFIVMIGVKLSEKEADQEHPYGHERLECVAAVILAVVLFITGLGIGSEGIRKLVNSNDKNIVVPGMLAMYAAILSILVKEGMYQYTKRNADKINSGALLADAWHHRSDALSSVGSLIGILGTRLGFAFMDPLASVIICLFIIKAAYDIFKDAIDKMIDKSCDEETVKQIYQLVSSQKGVLRVDGLTTREFGNRIYADVEIAADGGCTLREAHDIAEKVHEKIENEIPSVKHIMVHVNPM